MPDITVILCTLNPRADFLSATLDSLAAQRTDDGGRETFDVVIVDNHSQPPVRLPGDRLGAYPFKVVVETSPGLQAARMRGLAETAAPLLIYVDDDNVLAPEFVTQVRRIATTAPHLGAWGGWIDPVFPEGEPPTWVRRHLHLLAIKQPERIAWSNQLFNYATTPVGAGLCVRRAIADAYRDRLASSPWRRHLGRSGGNLLGCEDLDLAYTAIDLGLGCGVFPELRLRHLLPARRFTVEYLERLQEGNGFSENILMLGRGLTPEQAPVRGIHRLLERYHRLRQPEHERRLRDAYVRGRKRALAWWKEEQKSTNA